MDKITPIVDESGGYMGFVGSRKYDHAEFESRIAHEFDREIDVDKITHGLARWVPVNKNNPDRQYWHSYLEPARDKGYGVFETTEFYY